MKALTTTALQILAVAIAVVNAAPGPATRSFDNLPTSTDAASYLSDVYSAYNGVPTEITGPLVTSLASELFSLEHSWETHAMRSSDDFAILYAAAQGSDASAIVASINSSGYVYGHITTNDWYSQHVPDDVKSDIAGYNSAWESVVMKVLATTTSVSTGGAPAGGAQAKCTGVAMALAAGAMGVLVAM